MKARIVKIIVSLMLLCQVGFSQGWIGSQFTLDTSICLHAEGTDLDLSQLCYCINEGRFYYADIKAFQSKERNYEAVIHVISLNDYTQSDIILPMPTTVHRRDLLASTFWINDMNFCNGRVIVSTQDHILLYHLENGPRYTFDTMYDHPFVKATYIYQDSLYYLEEDHDVGFKWFKRPLGKGAETLIRELPYEAPHVVQAQPNRYLFHDEKHLFFLSTRFPVLHHYTLDGQWVGDIKFDLPTWHPFEDEYIKKSLSVPYGVERIYLTMADIFKYSYPKVLFPLGDKHLLFYTQYDTLKQKSHLQFAIYDNKTGETTLWSSKDSSTEAYDAVRFPFNLFKSQEDKAHLCWGDILLEISAEDTSCWFGKTPSEYEQCREQYFKRNDPIYKLRIMRYKNTDWTTHPFFIDTDHQFLSLKDLPIGKNVLLVTHELECSACERQLLQLFNDSLPQSTHIGILHPYIPGALLERELNKRIKLHLEKPFRLYYLDTKRYAQYPWEDGNTLSYPAILFYETGRAPILYSLDNIFYDDPYNPNFRNEFLDFLSRFCDGSTTKSERY